jgi:hypothetical protein
MENEMEKALDAAVFDLKLYTLKVEINSLKRDVQDLNKALAAHTQYVNGALKYAGVEIIIAGEKPK